MLGYALQTLAARKAGFAGAFLALACAAALVCACGMLLETGLRGEIGTERYAGVPLVVAADQDVHHSERDGGEVEHKAKPIHERVWLPDGTLERVEGVPGVGEAVPEISFPAEVVAPGTETGTRTSTGTGARAGTGTFVAGPDGGPSWGHAWTSAALTPFTLDQGRAPRAAGDLVVDRGLARRAGLAVGDEVTVQATGMPSRYSVAGVVTTPSTDSGDLAQQAALFFSPEEARRLAGHPGRHAVIGVRPEPGVDPGELRERLATALESPEGREGREDLAGPAGPGAAGPEGSPAAAVEVHDDDLGAVEHLTASQARVELISMGGALSGTGIVVAVLVVAGTSALAIQQRRRELALVRAIGATPRQVRRLIGREAVMVGLAAGLLGAVAGLPLGAWLHGRFVDLGTIPETLGLVRSPFPVIAAVAAALLTAWAAARIAARRTARIEPAQALTEAALGDGRLRWRRVLLGALVLAGGVLLALVLTALHTEPAAMPVTYLVVLVLSIALALLGPVVARVAVTVLGAPLRGWSVAGDLAAHNSRANARRLAAVVTPLALLVGMASTVLFVPTTMRHAAERQTRDGVVADWVVASSGPGVPGAVADRLRDVPGVTAVTEIVDTTVRSPGLTEYRVQGVTPEGLASTMDLDVTEGSLAGLDRADGRGMAVSEVVADAKGLHPGDPLELVMGDGTPVELTVVAVYGRGLGFGDLTMAHDLVASHVDDPLADAVLVGAGAGRSGEGRDALARALADVPGVALATSDHLADQRSEALEENAEVSYVALGLVVAFTAIAAVNTLAMSTADRSRELALLRMVGATRRQILRMLRLESLSVVVTAAVVGTGISLLTLTAFATGMTGAASPALSLPSYLVVLAVTGALALVATALPARIVLREDPAETIGIRE